MYEQVVEGEEITNQGSLKSDQGNTLSGLLEVGIVFVFQSL